MTLLDFPWDGSECHSCALTPAGWIHRARPWECHRKAPARSWLCPWPDAPTSLCWLFFCEPCCLVSVSECWSNSHHLQWSSTWSLGRSRSVGRDPRRQTVCCFIQESGNWKYTHTSVITKTRVTEVLLMIKWCNLEHFFMTVTACACYMHITVQRSMHVQQEQCLNSLNTPRKYACKFTF